MPGVGSGLEGGDLPVGLGAFVVEIVAEEGGLNILAKFERRFVAAEGNDADAVSDGRLPFAVVPGACDHKVGAVGIVLLRVAKNLPWAPGVFLIPEAGDVQIGNGRAVQLVHPCFLFPEIVVVRVRHDVVPVGNRTVEIVRIRIRERPEVEIPLVGVVGVEVKMLVGVFVGLLHDGIFEGVAFAESAVAVHVVIHPLIDGGGLFADGLQRGIGMEQGEAGS